MVWAAKSRAAVNPRQAACRLPAAAVVRRLQAVAARPWFRGQSASAPAPAMLSAKELAAADPLWFRGQSASAQAPAMPSAKEWATADPRWVACRLPAASRWAAPEPEPEWLMDLPSELELLS